LISGKSGGTPYSEELSEQAPGSFFSRWSPSEVEPISRRQASARRIGTGCTPSLLILLFFCCSHSLAQSPVTRSGRPRTTAFMGVHVIPMDSERILWDQTVLVVGDRIVALGPASEVEPPPGVRLISARGRFLLPGLADMHVHVGTERDLTLFLAHGVTTVRNMWGFDWLLDWKREIERGEMLGPTIFTAGPLLDGDPPIWDTSPVVTDPREAERIVRMQKREGFDFVKVYVRLSSEVYEAVVSEARRQGMAVAGHVPYQVGLDRVLSAGQASIEHLDGYMEALKRDDSPEITGGDVDRRFFAVSFVDRDKIAVLARKTRDAGVWNCPTLIVEKKWGTREETARFFERVEMAYVPPPTLDWWKDHSGLNLSRESADIARQGYAVRKDLVRALCDAGAGILLGSDTPNPLVVPGLSVHEELENLVEAGLTRYEALRAGTFDAARFLGQEEEFGQVRVGARADLLLLDRSPLDAVSNASIPRGVMVRGIWLDREELDKMLCEVDFRQPTRRR